MLQLKDIKKDYVVAGGAVTALKGITLNFRKNEFVSILGPSGCGKTTLLNIVGGLDKYTSGDLVINGVSTKQYSDRDWDTYRNHSIGFIFQSYHLIPHQTILTNVELALTIAGVDKDERKKRAIEALEKVGLKDKIHNRPNQLSGGQAQRVAIARALINDPDIVLADEPTGALDSKTSVQIMDLLKEISRDRLVIMVTHNPELAEKYSTRIVRLHDGLVTDDSLPYDGEYDLSKSIAVSEKPAENDDESQKKTKGKKKKTSMGVWTAFMLSLKNLFSKWRRTLMVSLAGSIGIIGVSMVLAISSGVQGYIDDMEDDMLSGNPLTVTETAIDVAALMNMDFGKDLKIEKLKDKIYVDSLMKTLMGLGTAMTTNNVTETYINYVKAMPKEYYNALQFGYKYEISNNIYTDLKITNGTIDEGVDTSGNYSFTAIRQMYSSILSHEPEYKNYTSLIATAKSIEELPDNPDYILSQYDVVYSGGITYSDEELKELFKNKENLFLVSDDQMLTDLTLGQFCYFTQDEFLDFAYKALKDNDLDDKGKYDENLIKEYLEGKPVSFFVGENSKKFTFYPNDSVYSKTAEGETFPINGRPTPAEYKYNPSSEGFSKEGSVDLQVKLILQKKKGISYGCLNSGLYYTKALTDYAISSALESKVVKYLQGVEGESAYVPYTYNYTYLDDGYALGQGTTCLGQKPSGMSSLMGSGQNFSLPVSAAELGGSDLPITVALYPLDFDSKDLITDYLDKWNDLCENGGSYDGVTLSKADVVKYTDMIGVMIELINTMIQMITIALVAFTALSLVVSTVMVGIITYVSVVERIKEIGILRAIGARKRDIKRLFIAEAFIIGLSAGVLGILTTYLLSVIINLIVGGLTGIYTIVSLQPLAAFIMICVSVLLTLISGVIPASAAAKKDPVIALRTE